jgi:hypothetical protein
MEKTRDPEDGFVSFKSIPKPNLLAGQALAEIVKGEGMFFLVTNLLGLSRVVFLSLLNWLNQTQNFLAALLLS